MNTARRRHPLPLVVVSGLAAVPAVLLASTWRYAEANVPPPTTTTTTIATPLVPELDTSVLSFRRHPRPLAERAASIETSQRRAELADGVEARIGAGSCGLVGAGEAPLAVVAPDAAVIPASNQKLLVAAVALGVLGAEYRFRTEVRAARPVDGIVQGNLYLVGGGDPVLRTVDVADPLRYPAFNTTELEPLADQLVALGITTVEGEVVGDGSRYDDEFRAPDWGPELGAAEAGPIDALLVNDSFRDGNYDLEPNQSAARVFLDLLGARGITVTTGAANNFATPNDPALTTLALIESRPLTEIVVEMLHTSDNNTAEMLVKELGYHAAGIGTRQAGLEVIRATLERWRVPTAGLELHDGSGLSRTNRVSCQTLVALLADTPVAAELIALLPAAGRDGTLAEQLLDTPAEGEMQAKTGTLTGVKALAGSQPDGAGAAVAFAVVLNAPDADEPTTYLPVWEAVSELIAAHPVVVEPDVDRFAPR